MMTGHRSGVDPWLIPLALVAGAIATGFFDKPELSTEQDLLDQLPAKPQTAKAQRSPGSAARYLDQVVGLADQAVTNA
jgi:hypothetical protein